MAVLVNVATRDKLTAHNMNNTTNHNSLSDYLH